VLELLPHPDLYWPYPSFGAAIAALAWVATRRATKKPDAPRRIEEEDWNS
jgi:hypothetical protein